MASVSKRSWTGPDGSVKQTWIVRYKDKDGVHRQKTCARKKEADAYQAKVTQELGEGMHIAPRAGRTVKAIADDYLIDVNERRKRGELRPGTVRNYEDACRLWIVPYLGDRIAHEIDHNDIEAWMTDMRRTGRLSASMVSRNVTHLKIVYQHAARRGWVNKDPTALVRRGNSKGRPVRSFDLDEIKHLLVTSERRRKQVPDRAHLMRRCAIGLAAFCGMRYGEIFGLLAKNIDLTSGTLNVRTGLDRFGNLQPPKTNAGVRTIMLPTAITELLRAWTQKYPRDPDGFMFDTVAGKPITQSNFHNNAWKPLLEQAGLTNEGDEYHFHALRHFAASWMIENGWPLPDVARQLGHSDVALTLRVYAHAVAKRSLSLEAVNALASPLIAASSPAHCAPDQLLLSH